MAIRRGLESFASNTHSQHNNETSSFLPSSFLFFLLLVVFSPLLSPFLKPFSQFLKNNTIHTLPLTSHTHTPTINPPPPFKILKASHSIQREFLPKEEEKKFTYTNEKIYNFFFLLQFSQFSFFIQKKEKKSNNKRRRRRARALCVVATTPP